MCRPGSGVFFDHTTKDLKALFLVLLLAQLAVTLPLLPGDVFYLDDYHRAITGDMSYWELNGRPLATWLFQILSASSLVPDSAPLPLLMALAIMAFASAVSIDRLPDISMAFKAMLGLIIVLSPFLAQATLYQYDVLPIYLGIGCSLLGATIRLSSTPRHFMLALGLFVTSLCLYQTTVNYGLVMILLTLATNCVSPHRAGQVRFAPFTSVAALASALVLYKLAILPLCPTDSFNHDRGQLIALDSSSPRLLAERIHAATFAVLEAFPGFGVLPLVVAGSLGTLACLYVGWTRMTGTHGASRNRPYAMVMFCAPLLTYAGCFGILIALKIQALAPRTLGAFSVMLVFHFYLAHRCFPRLRHLLIAAMSLYVASSAMFITSAFRAVIDQNRFDDGLVLGMRADLSRIGASAVDQIGVVGRSPFSPNNLVALKRYPMLKHFIATSFGYDNFLHTARANKEMMYLPYVKLPSGTAPIEPAQRLSSNCIYTLWVHERTAIFDFDVPASPKCVRRPA